MQPKTRQLFSQVLGALSAIVLVHWWVTQLAPFTWHLQHPVGLIGSISAPLLATVVSLVAARMGARFYYVIAMIALGTFVYAAFFWDPNASVRRIEIHTSSTKTISDGCPPLNS